jgi:SHS2 domain-containing protein
MKKYLFLPHTADVKFQCQAKTLNLNFINCFLALKKTLCAKQKIKEKIEKEIQINGKDLESLLYNFLEEFLYLFETKDFIGSRITNLKINKKNFELKATILGDFAKNYTYTTEIKAITYNEMFVKKENSIWTSQVVLDV